MAVVSRWGVGGDKERRRRWCGGCFAKEEGAGLGFGEGWCCYKREREAEG
jgi:hypothetical protein